MFQKFVTIVNCILRKEFNASLGKCKLIQLGNLSPNVHVREFFPAIFFLPILYVFYFRFFFFGVFFCFLCSFTKMKAYTVCARAQAFIFTVLCPFSQRNCEIIEEVIKMKEQAVKSKELTRQTKE